MKMSASAQTSAPQCLALLYHHVGQRHPGSYENLTVSAKEFSRQVRWLARRGYTGICPAQWRDFLRSGAGLPPKPVLITFDDAYADIAEYALPALSSVGFGAAVFVATAYMGRTSAWDAGLGYPALPLMSAGQIRYWAQQGIEFGSHSHTHPDLTGVSTESLAREVAGSRDELAGLLNRPVSSFAYPFGAWNDAALGCVRSSYDLAFGVESGFNDRATDPHLLRRNLVLPQQSMLAFSLMMRWGKDWRSKLALRTRLRQALGAAG